MYDWSHIKNIILPKEHDRLIFGMRAYTVNGTQYLCLEDLRTKVGSINLNFFLSKVPADEWVIALDRARGSTLRLITKRGMDVGLAKTKVQVLMALRIGWTLAHHWNNSNT